MTEIDPPKILCVDDDANILDGYRRTLRKQFTLDTATGGQEALRRLADDHYAVILTDMSMPGMNGLEFLSQASRSYPGCVCVMLTGNADLGTAVDALNSGLIFRFLLKPCSAQTLAISLDAAVKQYALLNAERELLEKTLQGSVRMLVELLATVRPEMFGKAQALRNRTRTIAAAMGLSPVWALEMAALLSQVGLVTVPDAVLIKKKSPERLTEAEAGMLARVPEVGYNLLSNIPRLDPVAKIVRYSRRRYDGTCAGDGIKEDQIPIGSRLLRVLTDLADFEARHVPAAAALTLMRRQMGCYDPGVLDWAVTCFAATPDPSAGPRRVPLPVAKLRPGLVLASDIKTCDGNLLISAGRTLTDTLLERVRNFEGLGGIREPVYVEAAPENGKAP